MFSFTSFTNGKTKALIREGEGVTRETLCVLSGSVSPGGVASQEVSAR